MNYQKFPQSGIIFNNMDKEEINIKSEDDNIIYCFPQHRITLEKDGFHQLRSGPNWQGNILTLTTCKQRLRTYKDAEDWIGLWLAGFTPKNSGGNYLLWLAKIQHSFESNYELGLWLSEEDYKLKCANNDPCGDIYQPIKQLSGEERFDVKNFVHPIGHTRTERYNDGSYKWWKDIEYIGASYRRQAVFAFNPSLTFLWSEPKFIPNFSLYRGGKKFNSIIEFINSLEKI